MSILRIGGLATGLDTDQMVKDLMKAQRMRVDGLKQKRQQLEWKQADYRAINNSLRSLRDAAFKMELQGTYLAKKVSSSNEAAVSAVAGVSASPGNYSVTVTQLAEGMTRGSQVQLDDEAKSDVTTKTLSEQFSSLPAGNITFTLMGKVGSDGVTRTSKDYTIDTSTATINTLVSEINKYSGDLGITASYDSANNRFFLSTTGTGSDYGIWVTADSNNLLSSATGLPADSILKTAIERGTTAPPCQNAIFSFGDAAGMTSKENTVSVNGITLTLKQGGGASGTVTVSRDTDSVYNSIKSFIDQYNSTVDLISKELSEERYKDYLPLTDDQREQLSEKQEEIWEEKSKSGLLRNDAYLNGLLGEMRFSAGGVVSGINPVLVDGKLVTHSTLASVGIKTGSYEYGGKLNLENDGADLKKAIEVDPEGVMKLFSSDSEVDGEKGIAQRLYSDLVKGIEDIIDRAGAETTFDIRDESFLGKQLESIDKQILDWDDRLAQVEDRYYRQFTAMEKAINQMNAQSAWLAQQFGTGQK